MEWLLPIILGIVQGLTEFLPVSSSGHLELAKFILGDDSMGSEGLLMTVVLHFGTALATLIVFKDDIISIIKGLFDKSDEFSRPFALKIVLSMIPAAIIGLLFEDAIDSFFTQNIKLVCAMLLLTGILLFLADKAKSTNSNVGYKDALIIGISQAIAIIPGISRSGATISTATMLGIDKEKAARFSFLMVVPLIFGKMAKDLLDGEFTSQDTNIIALGLGFVSALITGYMACKWMISIVKKQQLKYFAYYCFGVGILGLTWTYLS